MLLSRYFTSSLLNANSEYSESYHDIMSSIPLSSFLGF